MRSLSLITFTANASCYSRLCTFHCGVVVISKHNTSLIPLNLDSDVFVRSVACLIVTVLCGLRVIFLHPCVRVAFRVERVDSFNDSNTSFYSLVLPVLNNLFIFTGYTVHGVPHTYIQYMYVFL